MLIRNIAKKLSFVTVFCAFSLISANCRFVSSKSPAAVDKTSSEYSEPKVVGTLKSEKIVESSGLVNSRCQTDIFWTHNDSGDQEFIYAVNEKGEDLGTWKVENAKAKDWEDIATFRDNSGKCYLYIGDIGNNDETKNELTIYKVAEPKVSTPKDSNKENFARTDAAEVINFHYPDGNHNAETLLVHPITGDIYVLTKHRTNPSAVYKIGTTTEKIADFTVPAVPFGLLTGGDISPDGKRVIISDYAGGYELKLPDKAKNFDEIWTQTTTTIDLGERDTGESVCYSADGKKIYAGSENRNSPIIRLERK